MNKKAAYLLTAYKDFMQVYRLAAFLCEKDCVYIHVDKKSTSITDENIKRLNEIPGCKAIRKYKIAWGGYTHVQAFLSLMKLAIANPEVSYIHMLTGEDYPLMSADRLHERFVEEKHIYMDYMSQETFGEAVRKRYYYYNWFQNKNVKNPFLWQLQNFTVNLQRLVGVRRRGLGEFSHVYKGLVYISMPIEAARDIISYLGNHPEYERALYRCQLPEEFFFQTYLLNTEWRDLVIKKELRYMDWIKGDGGSPAYLDESDFDAIIRSGCFFARKMHPVKSAELMKRIDDILY